MSVTRRLQPPAWLSPSSGGGPPSGTKAMAVVNIPDDATDDSDAGNGSSGVPPGEAFVQATSSSQLVPPVVSEPTKNSSMFGGLGSAPLGGDPMKTDYKSEDLVVSLSLGTPSIHASLPGWNDGGSPPFAPSWNLTSDSLLTQFGPAVEFSRCALTPATVSELSSRDLDSAIDGLRFASTLSMVWSAHAASRLAQLRHVDSQECERRRTFDELKRAYDLLSLEKAGLQSRVDDLSSVIRGHEEKMEVASAEKASLVERLGSLGKDVEVLREELGAGKLRISGLVGEIARLEREVVAKNDVVPAQDLEWLRVVGLPSVVDKVFDCDEFFVGLTRFKEVCVGFGERKGRLYAQEKLGLPLPEGELGSVNEGDVQAALEDFANADYSAILGLGRLSLPELKELCHGADGPPPALPSP